MKAKYYILYLIVVIVLFSCKREGKYFKIEYFPGGEMKYISHYNNEILEGETLWFYESGVIEKKLNFKNGIPNGYSFYYYPSGCMSAYRFFENGMPLYGLEYHDEPQMIIKSILNYNDKGEIFYKKNFDDHGIFLNEEGKRPE